ncbi:hypothetical protein [Mesorhizobium sp. B2-3-4]|uniref:hypothetical protein n=1 Tax=Mesorhizobium sp. B2-3-4 TaxID=2589959 RepID=UPI001FEED523|nr:hypothetical protein [Mesorhizobium sp. B2-3-4]
MASSPAAGETRQIHGKADVRRHMDDAKSLVLAAIGEWVDDGKAEWSRTASGEIELRLSTGEVFVLGEASVTRIA